MTAMTESTEIQVAIGKPVQHPFDSWTGRQADDSRINAMRGIWAILEFTAVLATLTSCIFFWRFHTFYAPDSPTYVIPAANMLTGHGFINSAGFPETNRTPGYPLLILPFLWAHLDLKYLIIFQHLLRALIVLATTAFAFRVTGSRRATLLTGILLCLDIPLLESANSILTEIFFTVTLVVILWLLWIESGKVERPGTYCFAAGLLSGASALIRPVNLLFFLPAAAYLLLVRGSFRWRSALVFVLAFPCLPLMWATRNYYETGYFTVSSISGASMLLYRAAGVLAINDPGEFGADLEKRQTQLEIQACKDIRRIYGKDCSQVTIPQKSEYYSRLGRAIILAHPVAYAKVVLRGDAVMILGGGLARLRETTGISSRAGMILLLIYTFPIFCFAIMGLLTLWNKNRQLFMLVFSVSLYFAAICGGAETYSRFRVPVMPLYAFSAAIGLDSSLKRLIEGFSFDGDHTQRPQGAEVQ